MSTRCRLYLITPPEVPDIAAFARELEEALDVLEAADAADPQAALTAFVDRMRQGSDDTIPLVAKKGRAMRLGERSVGHRDPGSQSSWMLMNCLLDELKG